MGDPGEQPGEKESSRRAHAEPHQLHESRQERRAAHNSQKYWYQPFKGYQVSWSFDRDWSEVYLDRRTLNAPLRGKRGK